MPRLRLGRTLFFASLKIRNAVKNKVLFESTLRFYMGRFSLL